MTMTTEFANCRWIDVQAAASYLGCSKSTLDKDRVTGTLRIPFTRLGRRILYDTSDLDRYLEANKVNWLQVGEA
ncbi:helix-turn-helix domain-containing protein [Desulfovibrio desulfuricans]|uniref:helix-turn-helix domain-containing protein n=1 Tax=Desulfovibrio desulfuricans TaxID=876 RepID=UPI001E0BC38C|nr:helix-turn-helix domain-containing protein [Desulfovibrio desulfuricans]MBT9748535.1 helix-turn-helix domain-containing protein [Desulfovibrio desulfuricans]